MSLKAVLDTLTAVPEALRGEYKERDGKFYLDVEGDLPGFVSAAVHEGLNRKLAEFRDTNIRLKKEAERFAGIDPEEYKALKDKTEQFDKKGLKDPEGIKGLIDAALAPVRDALKKEQELRQAAEQSAHKSLLRESIGGELTKAGARSSALPFLLSIAEEKFTVKDGKVVPVEGAFSKKNPGDPLPVPEFVESLVREHDFAFVPSGGGGGTGSQGTGGSGKKKLINPTPEDLYRHGEALMKGEVEVVRQ